MKLVFKRSNGESFTQGANKLYSIQGYFSDVSFTNIDENSHFWTTTLLSYEVIISYFYDLNRVIDFHFKRDGKRLIPTKFIRIRLLPNSDVFEGEGDFIVEQD